MTQAKQPVHQLVKHLLVGKKDAYCIEYNELAKPKNKNIGPGKRIRCRPSNTVRATSVISAGRMHIDADITDTGHLVYDGTTYSTFLKESKFSCPLTTFLNYYGEAVKEDMTCILDPSPGRITMKSDVIKLDHKLLKEILQSYL